MNKDQIVTAIREGLPFVIKMADGEKYTVSDRFKIALGNTSAVVIGDDDVAHILPMLTMTRISYSRMKK
jgi:glucosamine 6-phosphate synthetase-like amidotransferase/phosphosugar isomerase protein